MSYAQSGSLDRGNRGQELDIKKILETKKTEIEKETGLRPELKLKSVGDDHLIICTLYGHEEYDPQVHSIKYLLLRKNQIQELGDSFVGATASQKFSRSFVSSIFSEVEINSHTVTLRIPIFEEYWNKTNMCSRKIGEKTAQFEIKEDAWTPI